MSSARKRRILVVAGGSGGHIFPAVAFCQEFSEKYPGFMEITFATSPKSLFFDKKGTKTKETIPQEFDPVYLEIHRSLLGLIKLICVSFAVMVKERPQVVFGFGGYFSIPFILWAKLFGKKTLLHEQNVKPGRANRFLSGVADKIIVSFNESKNYFKKNNKKMILAKFPLRKALQRMAKKTALDYFGFKEGCLTVLVMGGSQGAHRINENFFAAIKENKDLNKLQIIHLTGSGDFGPAQELYKNLSARAKVFAFLEEMQYAYSAADLLIGRSGASCVAEILYFGLPSILIPYPYAGAHQIENARVLAKRGAAFLLEEEKITPALLNGLINIFIEDTMRRKTMSLIISVLGQETQKLSLSEAVFV